MIPLILLPPSPKQLCKRRLPGHRRAPHPWLAHQYKSGSLHQIYICFSGYEPSSKEPFIIITNIDRPHLVTAVAIATVHASFDEGSPYPFVLWPGSGCLAGWACQAAGEPMSLEGCPPWIQTNVNNIIIENIQYIL